MESPCREPSFVSHASRQCRGGLLCNTQFASRPSEFLLVVTIVMNWPSDPMLDLGIDQHESAAHRDSTSGGVSTKKHPRLEAWKITQSLFRHEAAPNRDPDDYAILQCNWVARTFSRKCNVKSVLRALVPADSKISEHILYLPSHILLNLHVRTLRISEPRFVLPRQQQIPISS